MQEASGGDPGLTAVDLAFPLPNLELAELLLILPVKFRLVLVDLLGEVMDSFLLFLERRRQTLKAVIVGANGGTKLPDLVAQKDGLEIGGVDCGGNDVSALKGGG